MTGKKSGAGERRGRGMVTTGFGPLAIEGGLNFTPQRAENSLPTTDSAIPVETGSGFARVRGFWKELLTEAISAAGSVIGRIARPRVEPEAAYLRADEPTMYQFPADYAGGGLGQAHPYGTIGTGVPEDVIYARVLLDEEPVELASNSYLKELGGVDEEEALNVYGAFHRGKLYVNEELLSDEAVERYGVGAVAEAFATAAHEARHKLNKLQGRKEPESHTEFHSYRAVKRLQHYRHPDPAIQMEVRYRASLAAKAFEARYGLSGVAAAA